MLRSRAIADMMPIKANVGTGEVRVPNERRAGRMTVKTFAKSLYEEFRNHGVDDSAASLGYYFVFSLFPFLFFLATLTAYLPFVQASVGRMLGSARAIMPREAMSLIDQHVSTLVDQPRPRLLGLGLAITLYSASRGVDGVRKALNMAYDVKETRPLWHTEALNIGMTIGGAAILLLGVAALVAGGDAGFWLARHLDVGAAYVFVLRWARWPVTATLMMSLSAIGYYVLPDVEQKFRFISAGAIGGTLLSLAATWVFSAYAAHFGSYNVTYGTIGGVIILMTWFYITGFIYLMGGEGNAILEHHSPEGKAKGARAAGEAAPAPSQRPSPLPFGAGDAAAATKLSDA